MSFSLYVRLLLVGVSIFITTLSIAISSQSIFPDLSNMPEVDLTKKVKSGIAELALGLLLQAAASYVPKLPGSQVGNISFDKTIKGMGAGLSLNGGKDLFFGLKEKYSRYWETLSNVQKGLLDLTIASSIYVVSTGNYMPNVLYAPYLELGGQGAVLILVSCTAFRGVKYVTTGARDAFINADLTKLAVDAKAKGMEKVTNLSAWIQKKKTH
jgi:hypothetical protein